MLKKIIAYILKLGHQPSEVSSILLTHYHMDHAGSAKDLQTLTGAQIAASTEDTPIITDQQPYPKPNGLLMQVANALVKAEPVAVERILKDSDVIGDLIRSSRYFF